MLWQGTRFTYREVKTGDQGASKRSGTSEESTGQLDGTRGRKGSGVGTALGYSPRTEVSSGQSGTRGEGVVRTDGP